VEWELGPLGDRAWIVRFDTEDRAARWVATLRARAWRGIEDVVLAFRSAAVYADPDPGRVDLDDLESRLRRLEIDEAATGPEPGRLIRLPVLYDGPDLVGVARRLSLTEDQVVAHHSGSSYRVLALGFLPGYPYAGPLPEPLRGLPRRDSPRATVPAGSVAIAGRQTGVYPEASPGGWHLLGWTPLRIVDLATASFPIRAGDTLRFDPIDAGEFEARRGRLLEG
jgi:KipI family sensor histidine kinase inhibitor